MDPKVYGKLLTHHRKCNNVDVEALRDRIPLRQSTNWPPDGIVEEQRLTAVGKVFWVALCWFPNFREFIEAELGQTKLHWPHKPLGRAQVPRGPLLHLLVPPKLPGSLIAKKSQKSSMAFRLRLVLIFCIVKKMALGTKLIS